MTDGKPYRHIDRIAELEGVGGAMLAALKYARNHVINPENTDTDDLLKVIYAAWDKAEAAGIKAEPGQ